MTADPDHAQAAVPWHRRSGQRLWPALKYVSYTVFVVLTDAYGVITVILLLLKWLVGEQWGIVGLFNSLFPAALFPALIGFPGSVLIRRWRLAIFSLPALLVFLVNYGFYFLPRAVSVPDAAAQFSILTYNTHAEARPAFLEQMVGLVREADADIVVLQEFTVPAAERFTEALADIYPYRVLEPVGLSVHGKGFFSRYPLLEDDSARSGDRILYQRITVDFAGAPILVYNVHPNVPGWQPFYRYNTEARSADIGTILEAASGETLPLLIVGDFNMTDQSDDYHRVTSAYTDSYREVGFGLGLTYPDFNGFNRLLGLIPQIIRLDYVFHSEHFVPVAVRVWPTAAGSDHHPLLARMALVPGA